jgi:hypothetical protein
MSILNSVAQAFPAQGIKTLGPGTGLMTGTSYSGTAFQSLGNSITGTSAVTTTLSWTGTGLTLTRGKIRTSVRNFSGTSPTIASIKEYLSDAAGTPNVVIVRYSAPAIGPVTAGEATGGFEDVIEFCTDISAVSLTVVITLGGTTPSAVLDFEIFGAE